MSIRAAAALVPGNGLPESTLRRWCLGESAPQDTDDFWSLIKELVTSEQQLLSLTDALAAARLESSRDRHLWRADEDKRARAVTDAFLRDADPGAPSYLWWYSERSLGDTVPLLAYARQSRADVDTLFCVVSEERGTHTRAGFLAELRKQADVPPGRKTRTSAREECARLLSRAAANSRRRKRRLVLVIDGLDEDAAWPIPGANIAERASIAALLPTAPTWGLRILAFSRRSGPLPADVPEHHPLRARECLRAIPPDGQDATSEAASHADLRKLRAHGLGKVVTDLLAVTGGGLRVVDLAHLAEAPVEDVARLLLARERRCVVPDGAPTGGYALSHGGMPESIRAEWDERTAERYAARLAAWAEHWRAAAWPEDSPPYLLTGYPRLLDDIDARGHLLLDPRHQVRLAEAVGPDVALEHLQVHADEAARSERQPLGTVVRLAAARDLVRRRVHRVPPELPPLFAALPDVPRARALARSEPDPVARAARLAEVAAEAARAWHPLTSALVDEAAVCVIRAGRFTPREAHGEDVYAEVSRAARALAALGKNAEAGALFRAVVLSGAADVETLAAAAHVLALEGDELFAKTLEEYADQLSEVSPRSQAVAVDILATIARVMSSRRADAMKRLEAFCGELDVSEGLGAVDVLVVAASALATTGHRTVKAREALRASRDRLFTALVTRDTHADPAHQGRELSGTLERYVRAEAAVGGGREPHRDARALVTALGEGVRSGVIDDYLLERAEAYLAWADARTAAEDAAAFAAKEARRLAHRRSVDARAARSERDRRAARNPALAASTGSQAEEETEPAPAPAPRRVPFPPFTAAGEYRAEDEPPPFGPLTLLHDARRLLRDGRQDLARERLEAARRASLPVSPTVLPEPSHEELLRAHGAVGAFAHAERLVGLRGEPDARARRLAALSMGCSSGKRTTEALAYAREAARLVPQTPPFAVKAAVAQALAHAGDADAAVAMAGRDEPDGAGSSRARTRRALTLVAIGLAGHAPERAAELAAPAVLMARRRIDAGSPRNQLPVLASLLLASPVPLRPGPELSDALRLASGFVSEPRQQWDVEPVVALAVLRRLDPAYGAGRSAGELDEWLRALPPERMPHAELAVLSALDGDTAEVRRIADAAPTSATRAAALAAAARVLVGAPGVLPLDDDAEDHGVRLCLTLAHAHRDAPTHEDMAAARTLLLDLLSDGEWTQAIPLLPHLAPEVLAPLGDMVAAHTDGRGGSGRQGVTETVRPRSS
ncbi:hypothetical protein [Streptomyces avicenniae]|uniref:hypothetical protein n=1 Tax=Streptomyces avicenniae TaxID=500153 RepID=UPI00167CD360|nr:hypothetical protein [Streptomyces avicenniae]